jgi:hypothetical protein
MLNRRRPGEVRDAIRDYLKTIKGDATIREITDAVTAKLGDVPTSSIRSSLRLSDMFLHTGYSRYRLSGK